MFVDKHTIIYAKLTGASLNERQDYVSILKNKDTIDYIKTINNNLGADALDFTYISFTETCIASIQNSFVSMQYVWRASNDTEQ